MNTELFVRLFPVKINFVNGESPSPQKLNSIFNYVNAAFYVLESFLGNGFDYQYEGLEGRKMLFNLSSAIGPMSNLYKPINKFTTLSHIYTTFIALHAKSGESFTDGLHLEHGSYEAGNKMLTEKLIITSSINIPLNTQIDNAHQLRIVFQEGGATFTLQSDLVTMFSEHVSTVSSSPVEWIFPLISGDSFLDYLTITPDEGGIEILSISLVDVFEGSMSGDKIYNNAYAIPLDNGDPNEEGLWKIAKPCTHAKLSATAKCQQATCEMCIGNTYDIYTSAIGQKKGEPVCGGTYALTVDPSLVAKDQDDNTLIYTPVTYAINEPAQYTLQSCLLLTSKPFMVKYASFAAHNNLPAGTILPQNGSIIYDITAQYNPLKYEIPIISAGRSDIIYVSDIKSELVPGEGVGLGTASYIVLGGEVSVTSMIAGLLKKLAEQDSPKPAVYTD